MRDRSAIAQYEATVVLVVISLSLGSLVYSAMRRGPGITTQPVFVDSVTELGGTPEMVLVRMNSSTLTTVSSLSVDSASSVGGILKLNGSGYSESTSLCANGATTFFSVFASRGGIVGVATDGRSWVSGEWTRSASVSAGWQELVFENATTCTVTLPGGATLPSRWTNNSTLISSIPALGGLSGLSFEFFLPVDGGPHKVLVTTTGGLENIEV